MFHPFMQPKVLHNKMGDPEGWGVGVTITGSDGRDTVTLLAAGFFVSKTEKDQYKNNKVHKRGTVRVKQMSSDHLKGG